MSAELAAKIQAAQAAAGTGGGSPSAAGYVWPVLGPVTSPFGWRWGRMHEGIDIGVASGTPIRAAAAGTVIYAGLAGRLRQPHRHRPRRRRRHGLRPPVGPRRRQRRLCRAGTGDRLRRLDRPLDRPAPALRGARQRRAAGPARLSQLEPGDVQIRQVPVALVEVEAVADEELVRCREADVAHGQVVHERAGTAGRAASRRPASAASAGRTTS